MSREKQIEEMAKAVCVNCTSEVCASGRCAYQYDCPLSMETIKRLHLKGYRKASDVAAEIFAEIDDFQSILRHIFLDMCDGNDYNTLNLLQIDSAIEALFDSKIAELKKKYTKQEWGAIWLT